ncbi:MAG TPA: DNA replication and repair protein RecF [Solirubrobacter sp.]|nr:DNA replication and repair protein RecF [Solirubrobacter sp.]
MIARALSVRDFRSYESADVRLGAGLTVVWGRNGAGKTNLLEALYFACTGRSCRTANEREVVRFGAELTRLELACEDGLGRHEVSVGFKPGEPKRLRADGATVERLAGPEARPLVSVFLPDRLELVLGAPALRRAHLDQVVAALWPARAGTRRAYAAALGQRNALLGSIRAGRASRSSLPAWDAELARHGVALMADRAATVERLRPRFAEHAAGLGLEGEVELRYRPRSGAADAATLAAQLAERVDSDLERGFTGHGPHRDELSFRRERRELRAYGSRGQQRLGLLALLLAEREELAGEHGAAPLLLLDDVMSELDGARRERLVEVLRRGGQAVITATELAHVPGAEAADVTRIAVREGRAVLGDDSARGLASLGDVAQGAPSPAECKDDRAIGEAA